MTQKELSLLFSPDCYISGQILLVSPANFYKLENRLIENSRIFLLVSNGSVNISLGNQSCEMKAPAYLDILDTMTLKMTNFNSDLRAWCLFITFEFACESLKNLRPGPLNRMTERQTIPIRIFSAQDNALIENQLCLLKDTLSTQTHYYRQELAQLYFKSFSLELGNIMFAQEKNVEQSASYISKQDLIILNFMKLVSTHFATEHQLEFYANALCISVKHLTRTVRKMTGKTPHTIICDEILGHALHMLDDDSIPISRIAEELHFADQASFCKFFKAQKKKSPMEYRRRNHTDLP